MNQKTYSLDQLPEAAAFIVSNAKFKIVLFNGDMGSGKTTLIKEICRKLGVVELTNSPTFSLVNEYLTASGESLFHFDFYRINNEEEAYDIGIEEYLYSGNWCFIEWPEKVENLLPLDTVVIQLTINRDNTRTIQIN